MNKMRERASELLTTGYEEAFKAGSPVWHARTYEVAYYILHGEWPER